VLVWVLGMVRVGEVVLVRLSGWCLVVVFVSPAVCIYTLLGVRSSQSVECSRPVACGSELLFFDGVQRLENRGEGDGSPILLLGLSSCLLRVPRCSLRVRSLSI